MTSSPPLKEPQAIVIGSGFGGAVAACRLTQANCNVLVLERGRRYEAGDFPALPTGDALLPDLRRWAWPTDQGLWDIEDLGELISVQAAGYGGGSLIYANVHLRPPDDVFGEEWPRAYRVKGALTDFYNMAAFMLDAAPLPEQPELAKTRHFREAAEKLGHTFFNPPLAVNYRQKPGQAACTNCGSCCSGCPNTAKNTLDFNYLAAAERHGAQVRTQCEVLSLTQLEDDRWDVECLDHLTAERYRVQAKWVFVCAGVVHTTRLLAGALLKRKNRAAQTRVGLGYYPNADAVGVVYDTSEEHSPSNGPTITGAAVQWDLTGSEAAKPFIMIQDGGYAPELERCLGILRGGAWLGRNVRSQQLGSAPPQESLAHSITAGGTSGSYDALRSPLDGLLDALRDGGLDKAAPVSIRRSWSNVTKLLRQPLLLSNIVSSTMSRSIAERQKAFRWTRKLSPEHPVIRAWTWAMRSGARAFFGDDGAIALHAIGAALAGGNAPRDLRASELFGYSAHNASRRAMLLAMGCDPKPGVLLYDRGKDRLTADLDMFNILPVYSRQELMMTDIAKKLGGELRLNPLWTWLGKPITVHSQGGCRMSDDVSTGVTDPEGKVHQCQGLYVMDGSSLCSSVGANPSATILAVAERNILAFIRANVSQDWPTPNSDTEGAREYRSQQRGARRWAAEAQIKGWQVSVPAAPKVSPASETPLMGLKFKEEMHGHYAPRALWNTADRTAGTGAGWSDADYRVHERIGHPEYPLDLHLKLSTDHLARFFEDMTHELKIEGHVRLRLRDAKQPETFPVTGSMKLFAERYKPYGLRKKSLRRAQDKTAQARGYRYRTKVGQPRHGDPRLMKYTVTFTAGGTNYVIEGYKRVRDDPGLDAWRDTSSLFCKIIASESGAPRERTVVGLGVAHVDLMGFLYELLPSIEVTHAADPGAELAALTKFAVFFFGNLQRIYVPEVTAAFAALFDGAKSRVRYEHQRKRRA